MRLLKSFPLLCCGLTLTLLSGCAPSTAPQSPEPAATFVAPYATDEEALAAATDAYTAYVRVTNAVYGKERADPALLATVASRDHLAELVQGSSELVADDQYIAGGQTFDRVKLQRYARDGSPREIVTVYLCDDLSKLAFFEGDVKLGPDKPLAPASMQIIFDYAQQRQTLLVSSREINNSEPC